MTIDDAIKYFEDEIKYYREAPDLNLCEMTEDWQRGLDACKMAVIALREKKENEERRNKEK